MNDVEKRRIDKVNLAVDDFGRLIREYRKTHNLSLMDMAELSGFTPSFIWRIENNRRKPQLETKIRLLLVMWSKDEIHAYLDRVISKENEKTEE